MEREELIQAIEALLFVSGRPVEIKNLAEVTKASSAEVKAAAEEAVQKVIKEYEGDPESVIDVQVEESTGAEKMDIKTGDEPPDILTVDEAKEVLLGEKDELQGGTTITVVVTREEQEIDIVQCNEERRTTSDMYVGETKIESEGSNGVKKTIKEIVCENGKTINEKIVEEEMIKASRELRFEDAAKLRDKIIRLKSEE